MPQHCYCTPSYSIHILPRKQSGEEEEEASDDEEDVEVEVDVEELTETIKESGISGGW